MSVLHVSSTGHVLLTASYLHVAVASVRMHQRYSFATDDID